MMMIIIADYKLRIKKKQKDRQILESCQTTEKSVKSKGECNCTWHAWNNTRRKEDKRN